LKILKWLRKNGFNMSINTLCYAAENKHFEIIKYILETYIPYPSDIAFQEHGYRNLAVCETVTRNSEIQEYLHKLPLEKAVCDCPRLGSS
jgi:hypothetical protein